MSPVINCLDDFLTVCGTSTDGTIDSGTPTYSDNCSDTSEITLSFLDSEFIVDCSDKVQRQFTRTWTATDACGNSSTCEQLIQIIDDVAPVLFCPADITVACGEDISADNLSGAEAFDSCSTVSLSFVDDGDMPADCIFDTRIINRTWTAEDACGNVTDCVQQITIQGTPCPDRLERTITTYLCEGATVNLKSLMGFEDDAIVNISLGIEEPIANPTSFVLPLTGCETGTFEFIFQVFNEAQCLTENSRLIIKTIPTLIVIPSTGENDCSAELIFECPNLYEVTWSDGFNSGTGTTYICLLYTSPSPRDATLSRMPSSA